MTIDIDSVISKITSTLNTKTVIGDPMTLGEVTLIPVMNVSFGFGGGSGDGKSGGNDHGSGGGAGGGARMTVSGLVVVKGSEVSFLPTGKSAGKASSIERILDSLPEVIGKLKGNTTPSDETKTSEEAADA